MGKRLGLFVKGICMGIADIIPGVSGGTMALVLGIYREFIDAVKSFNFRFLLPLASGIAVAMALGSLFIPSLLENHPEVMRALFFGLIIPSVWVPLGMIPRHPRKKILLATVFGLLFVISGYVLTDPNRNLDVTVEWVEVNGLVEQPRTLGEIGRQGPSSVSAEEIYKAPRNTHLRELAATAVDTEDSSINYEELVVPPYTPVEVPRPSHVFVFLAGVIAISAMVLPGISGSYILLILGCYYFLLNAARGTLETLARLDPFSHALLYVILFGAGVVVGLVCFSRLLSFLLREHAASTTGALVGLMVGCLRGIWPFRTTNVTGEVVNTLPSTWGGSELGAVGAALGGAMIVIVLLRLGRNRPTTD